MWWSPSYIDLDVMILIYSSTECEKLGLIKQELKILVIFIWSRERIETAVVIKLRALQEVVGQELVNPFRKICWKIVKWDTVDLARWVKVMKRGVRISSDSRSQHLFVVNSNFCPLNSDYWWYIRKLMVYNSWYFWPLNAYNPWFSPQTSGTHL